MSILVAFILNNLIQFHTVRGFSYIEVWVHIFSNNSIPIKGLNSNTQPHNNNVPLVVLGTVHLTWGGGGLWLFWGIFFLWSNMMGTKFCLWHGQTKNILKALYACRDNLSRKKYSAAPQNENKYFDSEKNHSFDSPFMFNWWSLHW